MDVADIVVRVMGRKERLQQDSHQAQRENGQNKDKWAYKNKLKSGKKGLQTGKQGRHTKINRHIGQITVTGLQ